MEVVMKQRPDPSIARSHELPLSSTGFRETLAWWRFAGPLLGAAAVATALVAGDSPASAQTTANIVVSANVKKNCTITADPIGFGTYDALSGTQVDQVGAVKIRCTKGTPASITLGNGQSAQSGQRRMAGGSPAGFLNYELYSDTGRATRWGTAAGETPAIATAPDNTERSFAVYGRVLSGQTLVSQGDYGDSVVATVNF
jgi:spore coat protein U domain-containing protein, fimbrial subunit CupE1/2/3/6